MYTCIPKLSSIIMFIIIAYSSEKNKADSIVKFSPFYFIQFKTDIEHKNFSVVCMFVHTRPSGSNDTAFETSS